LSTANKYSLFIPTNNLRMLMHYGRQTLNKVRIYTTLHGEAKKTSVIPIGHLGARHMVTAQPTLQISSPPQFKAVEWWLREIVALGIENGPVYRLEAILPNLTEGREHLCVFEAANVHKPIFQRMSAEQFYPYYVAEKQIKNLKAEVRERVPHISRKTLRNIKATFLVLTDVNPGKEEMYNRDFLLGFRNVNPKLFKVVVYTPKNWRFWDMNFGGF